MQPDKDWYIKGNYCRANQEWQLRNTLFTLVKFISNL